MNFVYFYKTNTPLNNIGIATLNNEFISDIFFEYEIENIKNNSDYIVKETELIKQTYSQLLEYFNGTKKNLIYLF